MTLRADVEELLRRTEKDYNANRGVDYRDQTFNQGYIYGVQEVRMFLIGKLKDILDPDVEAWKSG